MDASRPPAITGVSGSPDAAAYGKSFAQANDAARQAALAALEQNDRPLADLFESSRQYAPDGAQRQEIRQAALGAARHVIEKYDVDGDGRLNIAEFEKSEGVDSITQSAQRATLFLLQTAKSFISNAKAFFTALKGAEKGSPKSADAADEAQQALPSMSQILDGQDVARLVSEELKDKMLATVRKAAEESFQTLDVHGKGSLGAEELAAFTLLADDPVTPTRQALTTHRDRLPADAVETIESQIDALEAIGKKLNGVIEPFTKPLTQILSFYKLPDTGAEGTKSPLTMLGEALKQTHALFFPQKDAAPAAADTPAAPEPLAA
ncbi:MAG: hypothetical protein IPK79_09820 [Vampirovibrionales bacterium]|nr:hypothetical protein [Vampirovibrionales bacterium]